MVTPVRHASVSMSAHTWWQVRAADTPSTSTSVHRESSAKLGDLASYGVDPRRIPYAGNEADGITVDYKAKYALQQQSIKDNYKDFGVAYNGEDNERLVNGRGFCCNDGSLEAAQAESHDSVSH